METSKPRLHPVDTVFHFLIGAVLVWFCSLLGPLGLLVPIIGIGMPIHFFRSRAFITAIVFVIVSPLFVSFLSGVGDYIDGDARLRHSGLPGTEFHNLDPKLRCGRVTYGCCVSGNEWVSQLPYNAAVSLLTRSFGLMPGAYDGPYPSKAKARQVVAKGSTISVDDLRNDLLRVGDTEPKLDDGVGSQLVDCLIAHHDFDPQPQVTATLWKDECIVLRIPTPFFSEDDKPAAAIVLISRAAGRPFAYYGTGGYHHHFPPVTWHRVSR